MHFFVFSHKHFLVFMSILFVLYFIYHPLLGLSSCDLFTMFVMSKESSYQYMTHDHNHHFNLLLQISLPNNAQYSGEITQFLLWLIYHITAMDFFKFLFQWEAFTLPELNNFLRILDREEEEYKNIVRKKYQFLGRKIQEAMDRLQSIQQPHEASNVRGGGEGSGGS